MAGASLRHHLFRCCKPHHPFLFSESPPTLIFPNNSKIAFFSSSSSTTLNPLTTLLDNCQCRAHLFQIQTQLITSGLLQNTSIASRALNISLRLCHIAHTSSIFRSIKHPDSFCINTVIKAYACSTVPTEAVGFYFEMLEKGFLFPNSFTFTSIFSVCAKVGCSGVGRKCHGQAVKNGVDGVLQVENSLIHMYSCCGLIDDAREVFVKMSSRDLVSWNSIVDGFVKIGDLGVARRLFDAMPSRNVVSWNVMISGYLDGRNPGAGLKLYRKMAMKGVEGNDTTYVSILSACGRSARLKEGKSVHAALVKTFTNFSLIIVTALIDMYSKGGRPDVAQVIFDRMLVRNLVCWNAMILGHCLHGNPRDGLMLYKKMVDRNRSDNGCTDVGDGIFPNEITFIGVLCACVREGLLTEGKNYFSQMTDIYSLKPNFGHYWCMANLLASYGLVDEALQILRGMPIDADMSAQSSLWAGLLGLSRFKGDVSLGEQIAKSLIDEDPSNYSYYALLLNVYAVTGRWEDVALVKNMMKERHVTRMPGYSLLDLIETVHNLKVGA